jgi:hypothetical protein
MKRLLAMSASLVLGVSAAVRADDARCNHPPYGGSPDRYRAVLERYGHELESVSKTLTGICNVKFGGADRTELHKLGFTDDDINSSDTSTLAMDVMNRVRGLPAAK